METALTRAEMKGIKGGCMPAHWDVIIDGVHIACMLTKKGAKTLAYQKEIGWQREWRYNPGDCS